MVRGTFYVAPILGRSLGRSIGRSVGRSLGRSLGRLPKQEPLHRFGDSLVSCKQSDANILQIAASCQDAQIGPYGQATLFRY